MSDTGARSARARWGRHRSRVGLVASGLAGALALATAAAQTPVTGTPETGVPVQATAKTPDLEIVDAAVRHMTDLDLLVFEIDVAGQAGATVPDAVGNLDGAPVLGYVIPTNLPPAAVGFKSDAGITALAVTSHPDFDDTPLWDENADGDYGDDGKVWHAHWVLVGPDNRVPGGLAVLEVAQAETSQVLPPTAPGLPLYLDSPGFPVKMSDATVQVIVPAPRIAADPSFKFDAASAYLQVNTSDPARPMLGVYDVYGVLSGDLSLPYEVTQQ